MSRRKHRIPTYHPPVDLPYAEYTPGPSPHFYSKKRRGAHNPMDPFYRQANVPLPGGVTLEHSQYVFEDPYLFQVVDNPVGMYLTGGGSANFSDEYFAEDFYGAEDEYYDEEDLLDVLFGDDWDPNEGPSAENWGHKDYKPPEWSGWSSSQKKEYKTKQKEERYRKAGGKKAYFRKQRDSLVKFDFEKGKKRYGKAFKGITSFFKNIKLPWSKKKKKKKKKKRSSSKDRKGLAAWMQTRKVKRLVRKAKKGDPEAKRRLRVLLKQRSGKAQRALEPKKIVFPDSGKVWTAVDPEWKNKKGENVVYTFDKEAKTIRYISPSSGKKKLIKSNRSSYKKLLKSSKLKWKISIPEAGFASRSQRGQEFLGKLAASAQITRDAPEPAKFTNKFSQLAENSKIKIVKAMETGTKLPIVVHASAAQKSELKSQEALTERAQESEKSNDKIVVQKKKNKTLMYAGIGTGLVSLGVISYLLINRNKGEQNESQ